MFERCGQNAIADETIVQTLKGRIKRAPPGEQEAARRAILDLALQAVYDRRLIEITESATPNQPTELRLRIGRSADPAEAPPSSSEEIGLDREHCAAIVGGRIVKLTPGTMAILTALIEAGGRPVSQERLVGVYSGAPTQASLAQRVWRLRDLLGRAGERVVTVRGQGWALVREPPTGRRPFERRPAPERSPELAPAGR